MRELRRLAAILAADVVGYSRLMGADEVGTLRALKTHLKELVEPAIAAHRGRLVKTTGDGILVEFASVQDAMTAALAIQRGMQARTVSLPEDRRIIWRMGLNIGDVLVDGGDIMGDGVNLAARLESLSPPGGIAMAASVYEQVRDRFAVPFSDLGEQPVKNFVRPVRIYGVMAEAIAAMNDHPWDANIMAAEADTTQQIRFCRTKDGVELAWSAIGNGPPLIKAGTWMTHLEKDLESPIWGHLWRDLARNHSIIRYDARGIGLSDRMVKDISFEAFASDLETVIEATGEKRFALLGISQGCAVSIAYAAKYPERVSHLVLYGGFAIGFDKIPSTPAARERRDAMLTLMRLGWDKNNPAFRQMFTSQFAPDASKEQADWFNDLERLSTSPENAVRYLEAIYQLDVTALLPRIKTPTLVLHADGDVLVPFEAGRRMAAAIPGARLVTLASRNHMLLAHEPAYARFIEEVLAFLRP